ncbi:MAG: FAD:protein FMN transferase [Tannerella sp.]|jgi:thiamine biosynthesis lipoprotein|nr:FAD:protein FMN transferase [Tannerella sp.]
MRYANFYPSSGLYHVSLPLLMGTRLDVLLFGDDRRRLEIVWDGTETELRRLEQMLNRFDPESEVAKVNSDAQFSSVRLSDELWDILLDCRKYYELTDGCFDITLSDFGQVVMMEESHSVLFDKYGMTLDFGGYAKGYALKCVRKRFKEAGIKRALVNFGNSSILAMGAHPFGDSWSIGIEDPSDGTALTAISLSDASMSVSGNTPFNKRHIINPETSEFVAGDRMVAVVSDDPVDAEALTTAWIASGEDELPDWMVRFNLKNTYRIR